MAVRQLGAQPSAPPSSWTGSGLPALRSRWPLRARAPAAAPVPERAFPRTRAAPVAAEEHRPAAPEAEAARTEAACRSRAPAADKPVSAAGTRAERTGSAWPAAELRARERAEAARARPSAVARPWAP